MDIVSRLGHFLFTAIVLGLAADPNGPARPSPAASVPTGDDVGIRQTMAAYNAALNSGETAAVLPLYVPDGIFMAPFSKPHIGMAALAAAYDGVFAELAFDVTFEIREVVVMSPTYAYVRTGSAGTTRHASTGKTTSEANQELFILRKDGACTWRIARYSFSPTGAPAAD